MYRWWFECYKGDSLSSSPFLAYIIIQIFPSLLPRLPFLSPSFPLSPSLFSIPTYFLSPSRPLLHSFPFSLPPCNRICLPTYLCLLLFLPPLEMALHALTNIHTIMHMLWCIVNNVIHSSCSQLYLPMIRELSRLAAYKQ